MKVSGKGVIVLIVLLILFPLSIDTIFSVFFNNKNGNEFAMTGFLLSGYAKMLPYYLLYLIIAFTIIYLWRQYRKNRN